jgi:hypothetical protein
MKPGKNSLRQLMEDLGVSKLLDLRLVPGMTLEVSRIGYADEGLRLTLALGSPYKYNSEVKLGRADAEWLCQRLRQEVIHDQAERFHKGCRCQLCESLPESLQRAIELLEGSEVVVPQPSARQRQVILHSLREVTQSHQFNDERICGKCNMSDTYTTAFKIMCPSAGQTEGK